MKEINYEMLQEDLNFPLQSDTSHIYIWDKNYAMVANFMNYGAVNFVKEKILGEMKTFSSSTNRFTLLENGLIVSTETRIRILLVRGWGRLKYKDNPTTRQDNIANYLLNCLNS